jgi:DNA-binding transcriptional LysR family regulator
MNTEQLNCFLEAAKCKSFSLAASHLFVSQPTLSRNIATLEKELGIILFHRNSFHGIELTESGKIMMKVFADTQKAISAALAQAIEIENSKTVCMVLGLLEGQLLDDKLSDLINAFKLEYPNIRVKIKRSTYQGLIHALLSDELSVICMPEWQFINKEQLSVYTFCQIDTVLVVPKRLLPEAEPRTYSLTEFQQYPFITVDEAESKHAYTMLQHICRNANIKPSIHPVTSLQEEIQAVEMGEGIIAINPYNSICYSPNVHCLKLKELEAQPFSIGWKTTSDSDAIRMFRQFLGNYSKQHK